MAEKSLKELEEMVKTVPDKMLLGLLKSDERKGAKKLAEKLEKKLNKIEAERKRIEDMYLFQKVIAPDKKVIAGVDEAGRGPLAGPLVGAAVILNDEEYISLADSKTLNKKEREDLCREIIEKSLSYGVGVVNVKVIDNVNILNANKIAFVKALKNLDMDPEHILLDGNQIPENYQDKADAVVKGDKKAASIAAAGIIAKVTRDNIMYKLDKLYPGYGFCDNKGYPTKNHYIAIKNYGITPVHRESFLKGRNY
ncbi:ribonuclease HII [Natranaerofaba carboxydovora]|uniref:ribonuclease HII n=1 Tax=Natranaerofaba carboxydovora TaxID=2742683 RepID=UPI001F134E6A|nr:ribonuclease HII [Natranaerofaba carboxydovora]UMZ73341.1 Ribonuclease HII [Natranaerofaba carboxydovora]